MAQALENKLPPSLMRIYEKKSIEASKTNDVVLGRQIVWAIINYFKTPEHMNQVYSFQHLQDLKWFGDSGIPKFLDSWDDILDNIGMPIDDQLKRELLYEKIKDSRRFSEDIAHFHRDRSKYKTDQTNSNSDYSYEFLRSCLVRSIADDDDDRARKERFAAHQGGGGGGRYPKKGNKDNPAAPAEQIRGRPKAEAKPKAKDGQKPHCWWHQFGQRPGGTPCHQDAKSCARHHGSKLSEAAFNALPDPRRNRTKSPAPPTQGGKGKGRDKRTGSPAPRPRSNSQNPSTPKAPNHVYVGKGGIWYPKCCSDFLKNGVAKCAKEEKIKKPCPPSEHMNKDTYDKKKVEIAKQQERAKADGKR
jgi:hypothetical protein